MTEWERFFQTILTVFTSVAVTQVTSPGGTHDPLKTPKWNAEWKGRSKSVIDPNHGHALLLSVPSISGYADQRRYDELTPAEAAGLPFVVGEERNLYEVTSGYKRVVIQIQSWSMLNTDAQSGHTVIERVRTRMNRTSVSQALLDANIALIDVGTSHELSNQKRDGREWSVVVLDFTFSAAINEVDVDNPVGWIEHVILTSHPQLTSTTPIVEVEDSLRMIEEEIPPES